MTTDEKVLEALRHTRAVAWDGCHKIYLCQDEEQVRQQASYGYGEDDDSSELIRVEDTPEGHLEALRLVREWYDKSCFLKFISAVKTAEYPNDGYTNVIGQCDECDWDPEDEEEW